MVVMFADGTRLVLYKLDQEDLRKLHLELIADKVADVLDVLGSSERLGFTPVYLTNEKDDP